MSTGICDMCNGSGVVIEERITGKEVYGENKTLIYTKPCPKCRGGHDDKVFRVRKRANIPTSFYDASLSDFKWDVYKDDKGNTVNLDRQKKFVESFIDEYQKWSSRGLGFYIWSGIRGTGKTFLASCICNDLMKKEHMITKFVSASELIKLDQAKKDNYEKDPIDVLCECSLLVIDDLGAQKIGENWLDDILFRIIDYRYQKKLVTIITSNIKLEKLRLDDRVTDRLNKMCQQLPLPEYSYRQIESQKEKREFLKDLGLI